MLMPHYKDTVDLLYKFAQRVSDHPRLSFAARINRLRLTAVICYLVALFDYNLIASTAERQIERCDGVIRRFRNIISADTYADTQAQRKIRTRFDFPDFVEYGEPAFCYRIEVSSVQIYDV